MALEINPWVPTGYGVVVRLHRLIADVGWEYAKETYPEVRRILQHTGQSIRDRDPGYWVRALLSDMTSASGPVVVTDVRYPNEADALAVRGFRLVRVIRPSLGDPDPDAHESERALEGFPVNVAILNQAAISDLHAHADTLPH
ncbi:hypothetical protein [Streptomyces sp. R08]|uniref:Uncharacterized protein n=1 Tax=Streptomyces sp. R08 TaxID=3238624 RepID=A0AB39MIA1_9ACTN